MFAAGLSDVLDGWAARNLRQETPTGAVLDGAMDKLFALTVLVTLVVGRLLSPFEATVLSLREVIEVMILAAALVLRPRSAELLRSSSTLGKVTTVLQFATLILVLLGRGPRLFGVYATGACGALTAVAYGRREFQGDPPRGAR